MRPGPWAVIGHSFGGGAGVELATRGLPAAVVSLDGGLWRTADHATVTAPVLQLFGEHPELVDPIADVVAARKNDATAAYAEADRATTIAAWHAVHASSPDGHATGRRVRRHAHQLLRLAAASDPVILLTRVRALGGVVGPRVHDAVTAAIRPFLDRHLRGGTADVAAASRALVPDLRLSTHRAPCSPRSRCPWRDPNRPRRQPPERHHHDPHRRPDRPEHLCHDTAGRHAAGPIDRLDRRRRRRLRPPGRHRRLRRRQRPHDVDVGRPGRLPVWLGGLAIQVRHRRRPLVVVAVPIVVAAIWLLTGTLGEAFLGWTA